jgi:hypothetical protein
MAKGFKDTDKGYHELVQRIYGLGKGPVFDVGVFETEGATAHDGGDGVTVLDVAIWNEYGTSTIPERSFIRAWFDENVEKCRTAAHRMLVAVIEKKRKPADVPEVLGQAFVGQIQKRIADGISPANADVTVERKGSATPLVNFGQLRSSITHKTRAK